MCSPCNRCHCCCWLCCCCCCPGHNHHSLQEACQLLQLPPAALGVAPRCVPPRWMHCWQLQLGWPSHTCTRGTCQQHESILGPLPSQPKLGIESSEAQKSWVCCQVVRKLSTSRAIRSSAFHRPQCRTEWLVLLPHPPHLPSRAGTTTLTCSPPCRCAARGSAANSVPVRTAHMALLAVWRMLG